MDGGRHGRDLLVALVLVAAELLLQARLQLVGLVLHVCLLVLHGLHGRVDRCLGLLLHAVGPVLGRILQGALLDLRAAGRAFREVADAGFRVHEPVDNVVALATRLLRDLLDLAQLRAGALADLGELFVADLVELVAGVLELGKRPVGLSGVCAVGGLAGLRQKVVEAVGELMALLVHGVRRLLRHGAQTCLGSGHALTGVAGDVLRAVGGVVHGVHRLPVGGLGLRQGALGGLLQPLLKSGDTGLRGLAPGLLGLAPGLLGAHLGSRRRGRVGLRRLGLRRLRRRVMSRRSRRGRREAEEEGGDRGALHGVRRRERWGRRGRRLGWT
mmetsp:Transcript_34423/g.91183  ORF Transcript_34423/g.91183 Transcript_34423/m.91183 type:complete len:328 (+) Transcript_34423:664-1647(+)